MKKYIRVFFVLSAVGVFAVPVINTYRTTLSAGNIKHTKLSWFHHKNLFNTDFSLPYVGYFFSMFGISISPESTIIGKDGWLFLGDRYANTMTDSRGLRNTNPDMMNDLKTIRSEWDLFARSQGAYGYLVSIAPNKQTVVKDKLPEWARSVSGSNNVNYMFHNGNGDRTVTDLSKQLLLYNEPEKLYYKTDTHWNYLGAWLGFKELCGNLSEIAPVKCISDKQLHFERYERNAGDLSRFIHIEKFVKDTDEKVKFSMTSEVTVSGWNGVVLRKTDLNDTINEMNTPLDITSSGAINKMKVLWLRDSFGISMYPYFNATFSHVMQRHYDDYKKNPKELEKIIKEYRPDLVIITAVERNYDSGYFFLRP